MNENFDKSLTLVLEHEGGYVDHPRDPGGATNLGITIASFRRYVKPRGTKSDLRKLTKQQAGTVYRRQYWDRVHGSELPSGVDYAVFDFAVNSGPSRSAKYLQKVVGARQDGKIGPATLAAVNLMPDDEIIEQLCDLRIAFLRRLKTWPTFGKGWSRRVRGVRIEAKKMAGALPAPKPPRSTGYENFSPKDPVILPDTSTQPAQKRNKVVPASIAVLLALTGGGVAYFKDYITNFNWPYKF